MNQRRLRRSSGSMLRNRSVAVLAMIVTLPCLAATSACLTCINPLRKQAPGTGTTVLPTPIEVVTCMTAAAATCTSCTMADIISLCGQTFYYPPSWWELIWS
jgi:hypothetical protein